jgi:predicted membrane channel-forming protein YqfA (hemolysin III family)
MNYSSFSEGLSVRYKDHIGIIKFICNSYVTICINSGESKLRQVCILVYSSEWENIKLLKESEK